MKKIVLFLLINLLITGLLFSQISYGGIPKSFTNNNGINIPTIKMDRQNIRSYIKEDIERDAFKDHIWRFGINIPVDIDVKKQSVVEDIANGKLYRLRIYSEGAVSINFRFSNYKLPKGASVYIYNDKQDQIIGAFTSENNKKHGKLGVSLLFTNAITIEYFEPKNVEFAGVLQIDRVTHGYRSAYQYVAEKSFGSSGSCNNDVVCPEATTWAYEIKSVAMLVSGGSGFCSGALVNNTAEDETPYFLTANHCYSDPSDWVFWFNWHREGCQTGVASAHDDISGATLKARNADSDFCLVEFSTAIPASYMVFYSGWDKRDIANNSSVGIHHPSGDVKKISWDNNPNSSSDYDPNPYLADSHWKITNWDDGATEGGSSGSPLFNQDHRIVGQLHGGWASCTNNAADYYGKFSVSWNRSADTTAQLQYWLDPQGTNTDYIDGFAPAMADVDAQLLNIAEPIATYCDEETIVPVVTINNLGSNNLTTCNVNYIIDGDTPVTQAWTGNLSTFENTTVAFPNITLTFGIHTLKAYVSDPNGIADTINNNDTIIKTYEVLDISGQYAPIFNDFENVQFPSVDWEIINNDNSISWKRNTNATGNGASLGCAYIQFHEYFETGASGQIDDLNTCWFLVPDDVVAELTFKVAYRRYSSTFIDKLKILITDNCGTTWQEVYSKSSTDLATGPDQISEFIPSQTSDWRIDTVDLSTYYGQKVRLKFRAINAEGNNLYIDDINMDYITKANSIENDNTIMYPNPANNQLTIYNYSFFIQSIEIIDIAGKIIKELTVENNQILVDISDLEKGAYFVKINTEKTKTVKKLIIQ